MATRKAVMMSCDNPACEYEDEEMEGYPALGIRIEKGVWHDEQGGGPLKKVFACSRGASARRSRPSTTASGSRSRTTSSQEKPLAPRHEV